MVQANICNNGNKRQNYICGVEPATHTSFYYSDINFFFCKIPSSQRKSPLKKGRLYGIELSFMLFDKIPNSFFFNHLTVYFHPFAKIFKMRRCEKTCFIACFLQHRSQKMRCGSFAIGSCNVNASEFLFGMAKQAAQLMSIAQIGLVSGSTNTVEHRQLAEKVI